MTPLVIAIIIVVTVCPLVIAVLLWLDRREERRAGRPVEWDDGHRKVRPR
jgi:hypothetical protein